MDIYPTHFQVLSGNSLPLSFFNDSAESVEEQGSMKQHFQPQILKTEGALVSIAIFGLILVQAGN